MENIERGSIITGCNWPKPVEVKLIEEVAGFDEYIRIVGTTTSSRDSIDDVISQEELSKCTAMGTGSAFTEDPGEVFLALEAIRYRFAFLYDPLLTMNASKVDPLPHRSELSTDMF